MLCEECGQRQASIRLMTIVNGVKIEKNLCTECMAKMKNQFPAVDFSTLAGVLSGMLKAIKSTSAEESAVQNLRCSVCQTTYEDFQKTGYLGCANCYHDFHEPLEALLKRVHGHTQHTGRAPGGVMTDLSLQLQIDRLRQQLGRAIADEAYEEAARLRDQIRDLKRKLDALDAPAAHDTRQQEELQHE